VPSLAELEETAAVSWHAFQSYLRLFHPFMPFVTEKLWQELGGSGLLIRARWPEVDAGHRFDAEADGVDAVVRLIAAIRGLRAEQGLEPGAGIEVAVRWRTDDAVFAACAPVIARLVRADAVVRVEGELPAGAPAAVDPAFEVAIRLGETDRKAERQRLAKQLEGARSRLGGIEKRLADEQFVERAKPEVVAKTRQDAEDLKVEIASIEERLG